MSMEEVAEVESVAHATGASNGSSFDLAWGQRVLQLAEERTRVFYESKQTPATWAVFSAGFLVPLQTGEKRPSDSELARRHGFESARQASNAIITAKREFGKVLRVVVGRYANDDADVDAELRELRAVLARLG